MITTNFPISYRNGDWNFTIFKDGSLTKHTTSVNPKHAFPSSLDVKITNYCDLAHVCTFCHEKSNKVGKHADLDALLGVLSVLPSGIELAIGGGDPTSHPDLVYFLEECSKRGHICNLTVNQLHLSSRAKVLKSFIDGSLICGLGVSYRGKSVLFYTDPDVQPLYEYDNTVFHFIAGVDDFNSINNFLRYSIGDRPWFRKKILILGYKNHGNGVSYLKRDSEYVQKKIDSLATHLPKLFDYGLLCFDGLSVEQLKLKRLFTDKGWESFYLGDDGTSSMYVDAVEQKFATSSVSKNITSWCNSDLLSFFSKTV
jgi:hypothetical protein